VTRGSARFGAQWAASKHGATRRRRGRTASTKREQKDTTQKAIFYHAGCPVCVEAERQFADKLDPRQYDVEIVHLGQAKSRIAEAEAAGVKSVPAFVIDGHPYHINFGADLSALK